MTIVVAAKDENSIVIGTDKRLTEGDLILSDNASKILIKDINQIGREIIKYSDIDVTIKKLIIGFSGDYGLYELLKTFRPPDKRETETFPEYYYRKFLPELKELLNEHDKFTEFHNVKRGIDWDLIIVYNNEFYNLSFSLDLLEIPDNYIAVGSGKEIAYGSLHTSKNTNFMCGDKLREMLPKLWVENALNACNDHSVNCNNMEIIKITDSNVEYIK